MQPTMTRFELATFARLRKPESNALPLRHTLCKVNVASLGNHRFAITYANTELTKDRSFTIIYIVIMRVDLDGGVPVIDPPLSGAKTYFYIDEIYLRLNIISLPFPKLFPLYQS